MSSSNHATLPSEKTPTTPSKTNKRSPRSLDNKPSGFVTVEVSFQYAAGHPEETKRFTIHQALLAQHSGYFRKALNRRSFKESADKLIRITDAHPSTFAQYHFWLYHQRFPSVDSDDPADLLADYVDDAAQNGCLEQMNLVELYVLATTSDTPKLRRDIITEMHRLCAILDYPLPDRKLMATAFQHLEPDDGLCRWFVDAFCYWSCCSAYDGLREDDLPEAALMALVKKYANLCHERGHPGEVECSWSMRLCDYHEHDSYKERRACEKAWRLEEASDDEDDEEESDAEESESDESVHYTDIDEGRSP